MTLKPLLDRRGFIVSIDMYNVYDNAISQNTVNKISKCLLYPSFQWYFNSTCEKTLSDRFANNYPNFENAVQLYHPFLSYTQKWTEQVIDYYFVPNEKQAIFEKELIEQLVKEFLVSINEQFDEYIIYRAKANLLVKNNQLTPNPPHIDLVDIKHKVILYYVNDSDGDTIFYENERAKIILDKVSPKCGRILFFDGHHYHSSTPPLMNNKRIVLNIDLVKRKDLPGVSV